MRFAIGTRQPSKDKARQRMRRDHLDALGDGQARRAGVDHEGREAARARRLAGAREDDVMIGDAAVRDPGLCAVEPQMVCAVGVAVVVSAATSEPASGSESAKAAMAAFAHRGR